MTALNLDYHEVSFGLNLISKICIRSRLISCTITSLGPTLVIVQLGLAIASRHELMKTPNVQNSKIINKRY